MKDTKRQIISRIYQMIELMEAEGVEPVMKETGAGTWNQAEELTGKSADYLQGYMDGLAAALLMMEEQEGKGKKDEAADGSAE